MFPRIPVTSMTRMREIKNAADFFIVRDLFGQPS
jgi:hypothetical protein